MESQLRNGQITVRDFIRGLCLSDTFTRTFYGFNSNYKVVRHLVERLLGRKTSGKGEELSWSIVIATKGVAGMVDALLDSEEYLDNFGFDTVPYQRHRVLPGRDLGDTPFNITTPRYDEYHRNKLGFPRSSSVATSSGCPSAPRSSEAAIQPTTWIGSGAWAQSTCLALKPKPVGTTCHAFLTAASAAKRSRSAPFKALRKGCFFCAAHASGLARIRNC